MDGCPALLENPVALGGGATCLVASALLAVLSLGAVPPLNYGIRYNYFNKYADVDHVYSPGRHFIGPFNAFVLFPSSVQTVEFSNERQMQPEGRRFRPLHTRTKEGLALHLQVSLQYKLNGPEVGKLYMEFNEFYEQMFISTIRDTLIETAAEYEAYQLWSQRRAVGQKMQELINKALAPTFAQCWGVQILTIDLPVEFDRSIVKTQVQQQKIATMQFDQNATQIRAYTKVIRAEFDKNVTIIKAKGKANYTLVTKTARAKARGKVLDTEADVTNLLKTELALAGEDLVEYQQFAAVQLLKNASVYFGFDEGTQVLLQSPRFLSDPQTSESLGMVGAADGTRKLMGELATHEKSNSGGATPRTLSGEL